MNFDEAELAFAELRQKAIDGDMPVLPVSQWEFCILPGGIVAAGVFDNDGHRHWLKFKPPADVFNDSTEIM